MGFEQNRYLSWYVPRVHGQRPDIDLSASGVTPLMPGAVTPAEGDPWQMGARFEAALAAWLGIPADEVLFTPGATGGTLLALLTLAGRGADAIVENQLYEPMRRQAERLGPVHGFDRRAVDGWRYPVDAIGRHLGEATALVLLTEPGNPSGTTRPREELLSLADHAAEHGAVLLVNEVYRGFGDAPSYHGARDNVLVVSSLSKLLGAYWMRLGWVSGPAALIGRLRAAHWNLGIGSSPSAAWGLGVMEQVETLRLRSVAAAREGVATVDDWVAATPGVSWTRPDGPGFGCVALPDHLHDDVALATRLYDDDGVLTVPGSFFGAPGALRLSWLQAGDRLVEGLGRLADTLAR